MVFHKHIDAENLKDSCQAMVNIVNFFETGDHEIGAYGDPDLCFNGVLGSTVKGFYSQVLLDPPEEEFNAPSGLINGSDSFRSQSEVVGQKDEVLTGLWITKANPAQGAWIQLLCVESGKSDSLITAKACFAIHWAGLPDLELEVLFATNDEERSRLRNSPEACIVHKSPVHDIDTIGLHGKSIKEVHIIDRSLCDIDKYRDKSLQGQLGVKFDSRFSRAECCPGEHRKTQVNGRGINGVDHLINVDSIGIIDVKALGFTYQNFSYIMIDSPIPVFVSISEVGASHSSPNTHSVQKRTVTQAGLNVAQPFPEGQLGKDHTQKLVAGTETFADSRHGISLQASRKLLGIEHVRDLGENKPASVHPLWRLEIPKTGDPFQIEDTLFDRLTSDYKQYAKN